MPISFSRPSAGSHRRARGDGAGGTRLGPSRSSLNEPGVHQSQQGVLVQITDPCAKSLPREVGPALKPAGLEAKRCPAVRRWEGSRTGWLCLCCGEPHRHVGTLGVGVGCSYKGRGCPQSGSGNPREEDPVQHHRVGVKLLHGSMAQGDREEPSPLRWHCRNSVFGL